MSIKELISQGIIIQGAFQVKRWSDESEKYEILAEGSLFDEEYSYIDENVLDMQIKYMYAVPTESKMAAYQIIEVE